MKMPMLTSGPGGIGGDRIGGVVQIGSARPLFVGENTGAGAGCQGPEPNRQDRDGVAACGAKCRSCTPMTEMVKVMPVVSPLPSLCTRVLPATPTSVA